ncbi:tRNA (5-methylaminomethyl-2-thiouridylate)-methyltransferase [hydrothermal vent metagenome]|uniref:tRNA (5-methylaminomethyl-2-thiouridylate)-methyltransferase n=1 Tax=hydrothermal vent metagenome TaxID=652676 RepID=A0A3B0U5C0_9ZZZZ
MKPGKPVKTKDGSHTLFNEKAGEHYHSVFGAIQESEHIFIRAGLEGYKNLENELRILEIGFGTGLNGLLTLNWAEKHHQHIQYTGIEAFPVMQSTLKELNYPVLLHVDSTIFMKMHSSSERRQILSFLSLHVLYEKLRDYHPASNRFHVVFFDAFSPDSQPEMWTEEVFVKLYNALVPGGILVTYSCKGTVKRALKAAGFRLEKLPGPPGKREFLRATVQK